MSNERKPSEMMLNTRIRLNTWGITMYVVDVWDDGGVHEATGRGRGLTLDLAIDAAVAAYRAAVEK
jgi:hypothetical protein